MKKRSANYLLRRRNLQRNALNGRIIRCDIGLVLAIVTPEWNGELVCTGLKLRSHHSILGNDTRLKECGRDKRIFDLIGGEFRRNDNVSDLCNRHVAILDQSGIA